MEARLKVLVIPITGTNTLQYWTDTIRSLEKKIKKQAADCPTFHLLFPDKNIADKFQEYKPDVIHFQGRGEKNTTNTKLAACWKVLKEQLRENSKLSCIVFNACLDGNYSADLYNNQLVLGTPPGIPLAQWTDFFVTFYSALCMNFDYTTAFTQAKNRLSADQNLFSKILLQKASNKYQAPTLAQITFQKQERSLNFEERGYHASSTIDNTCYIFGGQKSTGVEFNDLFRLDLVTGQPQLLKSAGQVPSKRSFLSMVAYNSNLFVFGGATTDSQGTYIFNNDVWCYDIEMALWQKVVYPAGRIIPRKRAGHTAVLHNNMMYIFGGLYQDEKNKWCFLQDFWQFNLDTFEWIEIASQDAPSPRSGHSSVVYRQKLLIFGGHFTDDSRKKQYYNDLHSFDFVESRWIELHPLGVSPAPRCGQSATIVSNFMIMVGGKNAIGQTTYQTFDDIYLLSLDKYIWHKLDVKARPSAFHSLATFTEGEHVKIVIIGGYNHLKDEVYSSMMEVFATKLPSIIPTEMESIQTKHFATAYNPNQYQLPATTATTVSHKVDVAIIIPLQEEFQKLKDCLEDLGTEVDDEHRYPYYYYHFSRNGISCAIRVMGDMTNVDSSNAVHAFLETYKPKVFIAAGCAGSIKVSDVRLLDVVAATQCDMPFAKGAITSGEDGKMNVEFSGDPYKSSVSLLGAFENLPNSKVDKEVFTNLIKDCQKKLLEKADDDETKLKKWQQLYKFRFGTESKYMTQTGAMASSDFVGKSELFGKWLQSHNRKYVAVEMEGGGVASALHSKDKHLRLLILRGITDAADAAKNDMEPEAREAFRYCGIYNVMRVLVALIDSQSFKNALVASEI